MTAGEDNDIRGIKLVFERGREDFVLSEEEALYTFEEFRRGCSEFFNWIWLVSHFPIVKIGLVCIEIHKVKIRKFVFRNRTVGKIHAVVVIEVRSHRLIQRSEASSMDFLRVFRALGCLSSDNLFFVLLS
ncbi:hypothetical protein ACOSQ2_008710 [Xanthoceras sorbifolium]